MDLQKLLVEEEEAKINEVIEKYTAMINLAAPEAKLKACIRFLGELATEKQNLFLQNLDSRNYYFFVEEFARGRFSEYLGLYNNFDLEFAEARKQLLEDYEGYDFLPKVKLFLKQKDEIIIRKIAHYFAYNKAYNHLSELKDKTALTIALDDNSSENNPNNLFGMRANQKHKKKRKREPLNFEGLFRSNSAYKMVLEFVDSNFLNENDVWIGDYNKWQEIGAFIDLLKEKNYLTFSAKNNAIKLFIAEFNIVGNINSMRQKGQAYHDFVSKFRNQIQHFEIQK